MLDWHAFLARPPLASPSQETLRALSHQTILITGAGGSIGSALALRLAHTQAASLLLLQSSESHLAALQKALRNCSIAVELEFVLGNAGDAVLLNKIFATHAPQLVFHTAAYKQVPLLESQPFAALENNALVTNTLADICAKHKSTLVLLSTDKAAAPSSMLGASKRLAELSVLSSGGRAVRFGNVLGSRDSVTHIFARQALQGGPLTVTDPEAERYFLTVDDAVNLLLAVAAEPAPGLFAPRLQTSYCIADLARYIANTLKPENNLRIAFSSLRAGEKLIEQLWSPDENAIPALNPDLYRIATPLPAPARLAQIVATLAAACNARDLTAALDVIREAIPAYVPGPTVLSSQPSARVTP
ncbi:MAG: polysaccharide biosynthesis protein [Acidobacteriota bacterium]|nr:polysaccharide biosynthesis protein [Acidobacteriota bacterium]